MLRTPKGGRLPLATRRCHVRYPAQEDWTWLECEKRSGTFTIGSLMVGTPAPLDEHGHPFQVLIEYDDQDQPLDLVRDDAGRPLAWVLTADGTDNVRDSEGRAALRPAPPEVATASNCQLLWTGSHQAARSSVIWSSCSSCRWSGRSTSLPSMNVAPARTIGTSS